MFSNFGKTAEVNSPNTVLFILSWAYVTSVDPPVSSANRILIGKRKFRNWQHKFIQNVFSLPRKFPRVHLIPSTGWPISAKKSNSAIVIRNTKKVFMKIYSENVFYIQSVPKNISKMAVFFIMATPIFLWTNKFCMKFCFYNTVF